MAGLNKPGMAEEKDEERDMWGKRCTKWMRKNMNMRIV